MSPTLSEWLAFVEANAHQFTIQYPPRREYFIRNYRRTPTPRVREWLSDADELALYLHVPFCEAKCHYCNFAVDVSADQRIHREYVDALLRELDSHADWLKGRRVTGIDIGGGTPTRLAAAELRRLTSAVLPYLSDTENPLAFSVETTPSIAADHPEKLSALRDGGVKRVSLGVQSFNANTLTSVNRRRQIDQAGRALLNLRAAGFERLNVDVIFGLPGQTLEEWKSDLEQVVALTPDSITTYDCLYRGRGRPIGDRNRELPSPELYGAMYDFGYEALTSAGWHAPYGSTNFSRHRSETGTSAYFESRLLDGGPFLGLGNYATSLRENYWSFNAEKVPDYIGRIRAGEDATEYCYVLPAEEGQAKYMLWSLNYGFVDERRFARRFGMDLSEGYRSELDHAEAAGWLEYNNGRWQLRPGKFGRMHAIRSLFYPAIARRWMMAD